MNSIVLTICMLFPLQPRADTVRFEKLDCGLRTVAVEDRALPLVSVQLWFRTGSRQDPDAQPGLTRVAQRFLADRGYDRSLESAGARIAGDVLPDACYFATAAPREFLSVLLQGENLRLRATSADADTLRAWVDGIRGAFELEIAETPPADRVVLDAMFAHHPYRRWPTDVAGTAAKVTAQALHEHLLRWFAPTNAVLVVVGDYDADEMIDGARKAFAGVEWRDTPRPPDLPLLQNVAISRQSSQVPAGHWEIAWRTRPLGQFENAAADVLMARLCNPVDGTLATRLRERGFEPPVWRRDAWRNSGMIRLSIARTANPSRGTAHRAVAHVDSNQSRDHANQTRERMDQSRDRKGAADASGPAPDVAEIVKAALRDAAATPPTPVELNRARALAGARVRRRFSGFHNRAIELGWHEAVGGDVLLAQFELDRPTQVHAGDVQSAAKWLLETRSVWIMGTGAMPEKPPRPAVPITRRETKAPPTLPSLQPIERPLAVATGKLDSGVEVRACQFPGTVEACVLIDLGPDAIGEPAVRETLAAALTSDASLADYLSYHGIELAVTPTGVRALGPPDRWDSMLEVAAKLMRTDSNRNTWPAKPAGRPRIAIVAGEAPAQIVAAVRQHQQDWTLPVVQPGAPTSGPSVPQSSDAALRVMLDSPAALADRLINIGDVRSLMDASDESAVRGEPKTPK